MPRLLRFSAGRESILGVSSDTISIRDLRGKTQRTTFTVVKEILERFPMESHKIVNIRLNHNFCYTFSFFLGKTVEASGIFGRGGYIKRVKRTTH